jgi:hypothetical protein
MSSKDEKGQKEKAKEETFTFLAGSLDISAEDIDRMFAEVDATVCPSGTPKLDADFAGYMELEGAEKDGDCKIVNVEGGISKELGCCNLFHKIAGAKKFSCGNCKYED